MNLCRAIVMMIVLLAAPPAHSSETPWSLKEKVDHSTVVAVVCVTKVTLGKIENHNDWIASTQECTITVDVEEHILGKTARSISFTAHSVDYEDESGGMHSCSVGFSSDGIKPKDRFIAYLNKDGKRYFLAGNSNQFLEEIDAKGERVADVGQGGKFSPVLLTEKLSDLRKLVEQKERKAKNDTQSKERSSED